MIRKFFLNIYIGIIKKIPKSLNDFDGVKGITRKISSEGD